VTGIWNSQFINALIGQEANRAVRYHRALSVLVVELDHAEHVHKELGHIQLEGLLREISERLGQAIRDTDTVAFLDVEGPPHFAIVLPETDEQGATLAADKIRRSIASHDFATSGNWKRITVSCGAATIDVIPASRDAEAGLMNRREYTGNLLREAFHALETGRSSGTKSTLASTRVYLIRHADVENPRRLLYGHLDGFQLSALGRAQAAAVGDSLRTVNLRRIVHSPLARAVETADLINSRLDPPAILEADPELREAEFSRYLQGLPYWHIPLRRPLWFVHKARRGLVPGDESVERMGGRILGVMRRMAREHPGETMAIVSHADPLQAAWILLDGRPHNEREMYRKAVDKAGMLVVDMDGDKPVRWEYVPPPKVEKQAVA
jgi:diguanylate cyclase (GGDEF)-like protein